MICCNELLITKQIYGLICNCIYDIKSLDQNSSEPYFVDIFLISQCNIPVLIYLLQLIPKSAEFNS